MHAPGGWATLVAVDARARLIGLLAAALGLRLWLAWSDLETLLLRVTSDDAFYYFEIARHLVAGHGASFDGTTPTNGFHPLWLMLSTGVQAIVHDPVTALHVSLSFGALLGTLTVALTAQVVQRLGGDEFASLAAAAVVAFHPIMVIESVNGLETASAVCLIAAVTSLVSELWQRQEAPTLRDAVVLGSAGGLMLLARTDTVFVWAGVLLFLALQRRNAERFKWILVAGGVSAAWGAPWLVWNLMRFGTVVQVSAMALAEPLRADYLAQHGDTFAVAFDRGWNVMQRAFGDTLVHLYLIPRPLDAWLGWLLAAGGLAALLSSGESRRRFGILMVPGAGILLGLVIHAGIRWWLREWYFAPVGWLTAVCVGLVLVALRERLPRRAVDAAAVFVVACVVSGWAAPGWRPESPHRVQQLAGARWLARNTPTDARLGAFNAGIYGYFSGRRVVNLDGVVNAEAYRANRSGQLLYYVLAQRIEYVIDWRGTLPLLRCSENPAVRCERVAVIGERLDNFAGSPVTVIRIRVAPPAAGR